MPDDPTPLGDAMTHRFSQQQIPQQKADVKDVASPGKADTDISRRPSLPEHPTPMPADRDDGDEQKEGRGDA